MGRQAVMLTLGIASAMGCSGKSEEAAQEEAKSASTKATTTSKRAEIVLAQAGAGAVDVLVREEMTRAHADNRTLIVYVGASWCEPCEYFLEAIHSDSPPPELALFRFLKFDHDSDETRLQAAGYGGDMIPRFVRPGAAGRGGPIRFEGAIKGPGAVDYLVPKLQALASE